MGDISGEEMIRRLVTLVLSLVFLALILTTFLPLLVLVGVVIILDLFT